MKAFLMFVLLISTYNLIYPQEPSFLNHKKIIHSKSVEPTPLIFNDPYNEFRNSSISKAIKIENLEKKQNITQTNEWITYLDGRYPHAFAFEDDLVWITTNWAGLVCVNRTTNEKTFYNKANSILPTNEIWSLSIDSDDKKWIGTWGAGLIVFDGINWTEYNKSNSDLASDTILSIAIDQNNIKWFGTTSGLVRYDGVNWTTYDTTNSDIPSNNIWTVMIDDSGNIWIGTWISGLAKFDGTNWTIYNIYNSPLPDNGINTLNEDLYGNIWIGTYQDGIVKFDGNNWVNYNTYNSGIPSDDIYALSIDKNDVKWVGTVGGGIAKFDGNNWIVYNSSNSGIQGDMVYGLAIDNFDKKWMGLYGVGTMQFDDLNWQFVNTSNSGLPGFFITEIKIDKHNNKWIGTAENGLVKFDGTNWVVYDTSNSGIPSNYIYWSLAIDDEDNKWISTPEGLVKFDGTNWVVYDTSNSGLPSNYILDIKIDENGNKWLGSFWGDLTKFDGVNWTTWSGFGLGGPVYSIEFYQNTIWIATEYGLFKYDEGQNSFLLFYPPAGISTICYNSIVKDNWGSLWVSSYGAGLLRWRFTQPFLGWSVFDSDNSGLIENLLREIAIDSSGNIIAGGGLYTGFEYIGHGISIFDGINGWQSFNTSNSPLPYDYITSIAVDTFGNKWIGTPSGIAVYNSENILSIDEASPSLSMNFILNQNYPNPFNPNTKISFSIPNTSLVNLKVFNILGQEIATLVNEEKPSGNYEVNFNASTLASGVYSYKLQAGDFVQTRKMILLK